MITWHGQTAPGQGDICRLKLHIEMRHAALGCQVERPNVGLRVKTVCDAPPVGDLADQRLHLGVIGATHCQAIKGDV